MSWRLLVHEAADGAWNMAVDEALLASYVNASGPMAPTLRLYAWDPPALSLGRGQDAGASHDPRYLQDQGIDLVRRPTGGRAVLHEWECTYAVIGQLGSGPFSRGVLETYRRVARALEQGLRSLGVVAQALPESSRERSRDERDRGPACFAVTSTHEITVEGRKLLGSAQLRRRGAFLQHGSIPLRADASRLAQTVASSRSGPDSTDLERALGRLPPAHEVEHALIEGFEISFAVELRRSCLTAAEALRAERLRCWKYDSAAWTLTGRTGERERRWGPGAVELSGSAAG